MKYSLLLISILIFSGEVFSQSAPNVTHLLLEGKRDGSISGNLSQGHFIDDLSWAWQSNVACFVKTQEKKFTGHHVLYSIDVPAGHEYQIMVTPKDPTANFSIYAYMVGEITPKNTVPNLSSCIRCEADFKWDYKRRGVVQDHSRKVRDILATDRPFNAVIGVVGAEGLSEGDYILNIKRI